ncbi:carbohydrate ABC transporter permease [Leifsonia shinshuensis]|uniref:Carbohydrate ABC transporter permease n=1 Tax=Leifsonia shinshuensis TaxID=150026 RepID=A0A7G6YAC0_9MICO|nr:carbohydrate ABC transporter permease [Leifsonia shinshuensis]QNE35435.1 carbohydrate ABC transporter permease [Leifsonia shinshuensis]
MTTTTTAPQSANDGQMLELPAPATRRSARRRPESFTVISYIGVSLFALICIFPFWLIVSGSFTSEKVLSRTGYSLWPSPFSLDAYIAIFTGPRLGLAYFSTIFITAVGTFLAVMATSGISWVIARGLPRISRFLAVFSYIPMIFAGGLVPFYILVTQYLQLRDSYFAVILPLMVAPFLIFVQVSFFRGIPIELLESARLDGAGELRIFFRIVLPLSKPVIAVIALFYAVTYWNDWFMALLFISNTDMYPLQLVLQNLISSVSNAANLSNAPAAPVYQLRLAMTVVTVGPILLAYPFAQRYFVKGLTLGASKG